MTKKTRFYLFTVIVPVIVLLGFLGYAFQNQLLTGLANVLIVNDRLQQADMIYVLNGEINTRPFHAVGLLKQELAPKIVIPRQEGGPATKMGLLPNGTDVSVEILKQLGVPEESITVLETEGGVTSTFDEAVALRNYVEANELERVIVVTSALHTRRSKWIFSKVLADSGVTIQMAAAPHWGYDAATWWQDERGLLMINQEYIKLAYYFWKY